MSHRQSQHAQGVVKVFKKRITKHFGEDRLDDETYETLELLIESAISTALLEELAEATKEVERACKALHRQAEHFDS